MKKLIGFAVALIATPALYANNAATTVEWTESGTRFAECLGTDVTGTVMGRDIFKEFYDHNGNFHHVRNSRWVGQFYAVGSDMTWTVKGGGPDTFKFNANNPQLLVTAVRHEVAKADGDYPNLLWTFVFSGTINANGDLVTLRSIQDVRCVSH